MNKKQIREFNDIIASHNQFTHNSLLWAAIKDVWKVSEKKAKQRAKEFCNVISFYAVLKSSDLINVSLYQFMLDGKKNKYKLRSIIRKDGYIRSKRALLKIYGVSLDWKYFETYICFDTDFLDEKCFYQMRISTGKRSKHFMGAYVENGKLYLSDSSSRGIGVLARNKIDKDQFDWILKIS